jgi:hypothetical protein
LHPHELGGGVVSIALPSYNKTKNIIRSTDIIALHQARVVAFGVVAFAISEVAVEEGVANKIYKLLPKKALNSIKALRTISEFNYSEPILSP